MPTKKPDVFDPACPSREVLGLISGKWSLMVICSLSAGPVRTLMLKRRIGGISQKMLTQTLRELERHGLIERIDYGEVPPRVDYRLTSLGKSLGPVVKAMEDWITRHYPRMRAAATSFDSDQAA
jgi:DNA-binding HxlR family transcriptional regulator